MATTPHVYKTHVHAAKAWAKRNGYEGRLGGFIYRVGGHSYVCQGWGEFAKRLIRNRTIVPADPKGCTYVIVEG